MSTQTNSAQLQVKSINALSNANVAQKIAAQIVLDFSTYSPPVGTTAVEVDLSLLSSNQPSQNNAAFQTLALCMEFDHAFAVSHWGADYLAGDLIITVSDTGFKVRVPGMYIVNPTSIDPTLTIADQLFVRNLIIPIVATQNSIIKFTKMMDAPVVDGTYGAGFSGLATIVLLNYEIPPVTLS